MSPRVVSITPRKGRRELFIVALDEGEPMELRVESLSSIKTGDELTTERIESIIRTDQRIRCRESAWKLLSIRPRSRMELFRALRKRNYLTVTIEMLLDDLEMKGFLDDTAFAKQFAQERHRKLLGPRLIRQQLAERGITREEAAEVTGKLDDREVQRDSVLTILRKWNRRSKPEDPQKRRQAAAAFLLRRGFDSDVVWSAVKEVLDAPPEDE